ncbi:hypothetical protein MMPV_009479 [Pyropia vietnamensis]
MAAAIAAVAAVAAAAVTEAEAAARVEEAAGAAVANETAAVAFAPPSQARERSGPPLRWATPPLAAMGGRQKIDSSAGGAPVPPSGRRRWRRWRRQVATPVGYPRYPSPGDVGLGGRRRHRCHYRCSCRGGAPAGAAAAAVDPPAGRGGGRGGGGGSDGVLPRLFSRPPSGLGRAATAAVLADAQWPPAFPYDAADWARVDETPDTVFYSFPRFVYHLDDAAVRAQAAYFARLTAPRPDGRLPDVLDLCASWVSFLPPAYTAAAEAAGAGAGERKREGVAAERRRPLVAGVGLNEEELAANPQLSTYTVLDLNAGPSVPRLPYPDGAFDVVVCAVSIDYLTRPLEVAAELARVLRPGGVVAATFSNRSFGTKAVAAWSAGGDADHIYLVGAVLHYAGGGGVFDQLLSVDLSPPGGGDPLYAVEARRV